MPEAVGSGSCAAVGVGYGHEVRAWGHARQVFGGGAVAPAVGQRGGSIAHRQVEGTVGAPGAGHGSRGGGELQIAAGHHYHVQRDGGNARGAAVVGSGQDNGVRTYVAWGARNDDVRVGDGAIGGRHTGVAQPVRVHVHIHGLVHFRSQKPWVERYGLATGYGHRVIEGHIIGRGRRVARIAYIKAKALPVEVIHAVVGSAGAVVVRVVEVETAHLHVIKVIAVVDTHRGRDTHEPTDPARGQARGPLHVAVAQAHVLAGAQQGIGFGANNGLESTQLIRHGAVIAHVVPRHNQVGGAQLVVNQAAGGVARVHIGPKGCHHGHTRRKARR